MFRVTTISGGWFATAETDDVAGFCHTTTAQVVRIERIG